MELAEELAVAETDDDWSKKSIEEQRSIIYNYPFILRKMAKENEDLQRLKETPNFTSDLLQMLFVIGLLTAVTVPHESRNC